MVKMKKLISLFLTLAVALYCLPPYSPTTPNRQLPGLGRKLLTLTKEFPAARDTIRFITSKAAAPLWLSKSIEISREGLDIQLGESAKSLNTPISCSTPKLLTALTRLKAR